MFLRCFDTVGWVIWSVKPVPDMTYNVFGGTLSLTQSINHVVRWHLLLYSVLVFKLCPLCVFVWHTVVYSSLVRTVYLMLVLVTNRELYCDVYQFVEDVLLLCKRSNVGNICILPGVCCSQTLWCVQYTYLAPLSHLIPPLPSNRQLWCLSGGKRGDYQNCSVLYCVLNLHTVISTLWWAVLTVLWIGFCLTGPISLCVDLFVFVCIFVFMFHTA